MKKLFALLLLTTLTACHYHHDHGRHRGHHMRHHHREMHHDYDMHERHGKHDKQCGKKHRRGHGGHKGKHY